MAHYTILPALALALTVAACGQPKEVEVGPYTVSVIEKNVWHIQDYNKANPAGESFDAEGNKSHFNNCSDIYLLVGEKEALVIDLSNPVNWADNAAESLRSIISERAAGKPVTITFTHNHGDHTGMLPAFIDDPDIRFAPSGWDFDTEQFQGRFPEDRTTFIDEGYTFDLGGLKLMTIAVPGHTDGSVVFYLMGHDLLFTGDAIGSGHGVWIFNGAAFENYVAAVPHLIAALDALGADKERLQIYGGHYWQKDWLELPKGREMGYDYLLEMKELCDRIESGTAQSEASNLDHPVLDTYFRNGNAIVVWNAAQAEAYRKQYPEEFVCRDAGVVFHQIDEHTWVGNGHYCYNESVYLLEGEDRALLIDAGVYMPTLDKVVARFTDKPVTLALTHGHGDHVGSTVLFPEVWIHAADTALLRSNLRGYQGEIKLLSDGDVIDLGGRQVEVLYTPGHTSGSITFFDKGNHYGFSGDAFGSTNLLLFAGPFSALANTCLRTIAYMEKNGIEKLYPGHYHGDNPETLQRVKDELTLSREVLSGKRKGVVDEGGNGLNRYVHDFGVTIRYNDPEALR
ncbi:MAG: MBL fold metallo-hydrolase [Bacteroidales bacterium]|nr:MBL fold metallo-hydrolase [Bacteroidales bacterium]